MTERTGIALHQTQREIQEIKRCLINRARILRIAKESLKRQSFNYKLLIDAYNQELSKILSHQLQENQEDICRMCFCVLPLSELSFYYIERHQYVPTFVNMVNSEIIYLCQNCAELFPQKPPDKKKPNKWCEIEKDDEDDIFDIVSFIAPLRKNEMGKRVFTDSNQQETEVSEKLLAEYGSHDIQDIIKSLPDEIFVQFRLPPKAIYDSKESILTIGNIETPC